MTPVPYKTLLARGEAPFTVNKSRFIGYGAPAEDEEGALAFLREVRQRHKDASHNCYAYILGVNRGVMRYSDDGEPGGTAGLPIIEVMKARGVTNCAVVVTRYFGGVLLGAGGLTRAYARGAAEALTASGVGVMHPTARYLIDLAYAQLDRAVYLMKDRPVIVEDKAFADVVTLQLIVRCEDEAAVVDALVTAMDGKIDPVRFEECYLAWPEEPGRPE